MKILAKLMYYFSFQKFCTITGTQTTNLHISDSQTQMTGNSQHSGLYFRPNDNGQVFTFYSIATNFKMVQLNSH